MTKAELEAALGRSLTNVENSNITLYLDIASQKLEGLLCTSFKEGTGARVYESREGYSTVFTDLFRSVSSVIVDGETVSSEDYHTAFFNTRNSDYKNSIVFSDKFAKAKDVTVTGEWGFDATTKMPSDLAQVLAKIFAQVAKGSKNDQAVKSKRVEDFSVTFADDATTNEEALSNANRLTLNKYSQCSIGLVRHGKTS